MTHANIRKVVIVGGGTAGWMAAAALARYLDNRSTEITLIESEEIGTIGVGEATVPAIKTFNKLLNIDEVEFLRHTQGTFKLGIEFTDWGARGQRYFHPFGRFGRDIAGINFHQLYLRERLKRQVPEIGAYSISAAAAKLGRFQHPADDPRRPESDLNYAYHFDASLYAAYLRRYAEALGVVRVEGKIVQADQEAQTGFIKSVRLADGRLLTGELFIDCSGFRGLLIEEKLGTGYEDWSHWLPCDRAIAVPTGNICDPVPYTRAAAQEAGWQWRIPLQHRTGNGYVYSSRFIDDDAAEASLIKNLEGPILADPRRLKFSTGRRRLFWNCNVVALGLSAGFVEPLESTSIHLIQHGISQLLALFPDRSFRPIERDEYNRSMIATIEPVRDFVILHYHLTERDDAPFWNEVRSMRIPDSLAWKIEMYGLRGRFFRHEEDLFGLTSWVAVAAGQNLWPGSYDVIVDALDETKVAEQFNQGAAAIASAASNMPLQAKYLREVGAMARAEPVL